jgi:hypothetical protein
VDAQSPCRVVRKREWLHNYLEDEKVKSARREELTNGDTSKLGG